MSHVRIALILVCFLAGAAYAGTPEGNADGRRNSLVPGAWAIQFQIEDDIGLKPFNGMSVSLKRHFTSRSAVRLGATLTLEFDNSDEDYTAIQADTVSFSSSREFDTSAQGVRINLLYLRYPTPGKNVNLFWGAGPVVRYSRSEQNRKDTASSSGNERVDVATYDADLWGVGGMGTLGIEWFATKDVSFHAEYFVTLQYVSQDANLSSESWPGNQPPRKTTSSSSSDGWDFDGVNVTLGISIYF